MTQHKVQATSLRRRTLKELTTICIYGSGLLALIITDIFISTTMPPEAISEWARIRSVVGIAASICLIGFDSVILRLPHATRKILLILAVQIPVLGLGLGYLTYQLGALPSFWASVGFCISISVITTGFQYFKTFNKRCLAQLVFQVWKVAILITVLGCAFLSVEVRLTQSPSLAITSLAMILFAAGVVAVVFFDLRQTAMRHRFESTGILYGFGLKYMVSTLLLALALYAEQLLVAQLGTVAQSANYFIHATYFLFPITLVGGYATFILGPWIRRNFAQFQHNMRFRKIYILLVSGLIAWLCNRLGLACWYLVSPTEAPPDENLQIIFFCVSVMRMMYTIPSAYLSVNGSRQQHNTFIMGQILSTIAIIAIFILAYPSDAVSLPVLVGCLSMLNWTLRNLAAYVSVWKGMKLDALNEATV